MKQLLTEFFVEPNEEEAQEDLSFFGVENDAYYNPFVDVVSEVFFLEDETLP
jgi:hypothetical protein